MRRGVTVSVLALALAVCAAARRPPDPDFEFADVDQAAQPAGADDGGDFLQSPRPLYESDSSPCRAVVCRRREVCTVRADVAVCTPRAHHAHRNARARTTTRKTGESGDELFEGSDDDVLYESAHNDLEPEREQRARCVGCGAVSASGGERGFLCGSDNRTYSSLCRLDLHNCVRRPAPPVRLACRGFCPCRHDRRRTRIDREGALRRRTFDQSNDVLSPAHASSTATGRTGNVGTECSLDQMADRLLDWFSVLMQQSGAQPSPPSTSVDEEGLTGAEARAWRTCKPEVRWMFARLDADGDGRLSPQDLYALRHDERERCLRPFLATCAGGEGNVSRGAWCACLRRAARPCAALQSSIPARPGAYVPACDAAGFYRPLQCHAALGVCWCVDAHGVERPGSRTKGRPRCPPSARPAPPTPSLRPPADDEDALGLGSGDADLRF